MLDVIIDTLLDTLKLLPFLYLSYLLMEFLEHRSGGAAERLLKRSGQIGPLFGAALGILPQCGFSAAATGLYTGRIITVGTLIAVFLSTSDEMLPILISEGAPVIFILKILAAKLLIGIIAGFAVDLITGLANKKKNVSAQPQIEELCERERCGCGSNFFLSALTHTLNITVFILIFSFAMNTAIHFIGEDTISGIALDMRFLGNAIASLIGLIPNCASSVILTELYLGGVISVGAMLSGLLVNAGIGVALLFRNNRPIKDSFRIVGILLLVGVLSGFLLDISPLAKFFTL